MDDNNNNNFNTTCDSLQNYWLNVSNERHIHNSRLNLDYLMNGKEENDDNNNNDDD